MNTAPVRLDCPVCGCECSVSVGYSLVIAPDMRGPAATGESDIQPSCAHAIEIAAWLESDAGQEWQRNEVSSL